MPTTSRLLKTSAIVVAAGTLLATPALAHQNGKGSGKRGGSTEQTTPDSSGSSKAKPSKHSKKQAKPSIDLAAVTVSPADAAATAITAAGGGQLVEMKLEAHKKGTRLQAEVLTAAGITEVKLSVTGAVLKVEAHDDDDDDSSAPMANPPAGVTWATYAAAAPAGATITKISMEHSESKSLDLVRVEYIKADGKKGKVRVRLDGSPL